MQPQTQPGAPAPYQPRIWYAKAGEWSSLNASQFLEVVAAQDPMRGAQFSLLYAIRNRMDQATIALVFVNFLLVLLLLTRAL